MHSSRGGSRAWRADTKHKLRACAQFVYVAGEHGWLAEGDKVPKCVGLAPGRRVALAKYTPRAFLIIEGAQPRLPLCGPLTMVSKFGGHAEIVAASIELDGEEGSQAKHT